MSPAAPTLALEAQAAAVATLRADMADELARLDGLNIIVTPNDFVAHPRAWTVAWCAHLDGAEPGDPCAYGPTPDAARRELLDMLEERDHA